MLATISPTGLLVLVLIFGTVLALLLVAVALSRRAGQPSLSGPASPRRATGQPTDTAHNVAIWGGLYPAASGFVDGGDRHPGPDHHAPHGDGLAPTAPDSGSSAGDYGGGASCSGGDGGS